MLLTHWQKLLTRTATSVDTTLPLAVAILTPSHPTPSQAAQLKKAIHSVPFAQSIWLGKTEGPILDFAAARNEVLPLVKEPWVLWLDSDEWLAAGPQTVAELKHWLTIASVSGVFVSRRDWFLGQPLRYGEPAAVKLLRLVRPHAGRFHRAVHEIFTMETSAICPTSHLTIEHDSHANVSEFLATVSYYAQLAAQLRHDTLHPSTSRLVLELLIFPKLKFCLNFFWRGGWRDGWRGLVYATMMSIHSAAVRVYGWELLAIDKLREKSNLTTK